MPTATWKNLERATAKKIGGKRIYFGTSGGDVSHSLFFVECKYRKKAVVFSMYKKVVEQARKTKKIPLLVIKEKNRKYNLVVLNLDDFTKLIKSDDKQSNIVL